MVPRRESDGRSPRTVRSLTQAAHTRTRSPVARSTPGRRPTNSSDPGRVSRPQPAHGCSAMAFITAATGRYLRPQECRGVSCPERHALGRPPRSSHRPRHPRPSRGRSHDGVSQTGASPELSPARRQRTARRSCLHCESCRQSTLCWRSYGDIEAAGSLTSPVGAVVDVQRHTHRAARSHQSLHERHSRVHRKRRRVGATDGFNVAVCRKPSRALPQSGGPERGDCWWSTSRQRPSMRT